MSESNHSAHQMNESDDQGGFYNQVKSQGSEDQEQPRNIDNIPTTNDAFKPKKSKGIRKRERGHRKPKTSKQEEKERRNNQLAQREAESVIEKMEKCYQQDRKLYRNKKPANRKLKYLPQLKQKLTKVLVWDKFLENGGLQQFELWFSKLPEGIQPSLTLRKGLLEILERLKIRSQFLARTSEIQRIVQRHKRSQTKQLRDLSESILLKWSRTLHQEQNQ